MKEVFDALNVTTDEVIEIFRKEIVRKDITNTLVRMKVMDRLIKHTEKKLIKENPKLEDSVNTAGKLANTIRFDVDTKQKK